MGQRDHFTDRLARQQDGRGVLLVAWLDGRPVGNGSLSWEPADHGGAGSDAVDRYLLPRFGPLPLANISQREVRAWVTELSAKGLAPATVQKCYQILSKILAAAVEGGMIPARRAARSRCPRSSGPRCGF
jgi:hypothetical protein